MWVRGKLMRAKVVFDLLPSGLMGTVYLFRPEK